MKVNLHNRIALVTCATGVLGRSAASALAENGAVVVVNDLQSTEQICTEIRRSGGTVHGFQMDMSYSSAADVLVSRIEEEIGPIDVLINSTGANFDEARFPVHQFPDSEWQKILHNDLDGVFHCSRAVSSRMIERRRGTIVNIVSVFGVVPVRCYSAHAAAKAAVMNFTRSHSLEVGKYGIRVNGVAAGLILTEESVKFSHRPENKVSAANWLSHIPLGVAGETEDIASAVLFFTSDAAKNVTGQTLAVDGGWTVGFSRDW